MLLEEIPLEAWLREGRITVDFLDVYAQLSDFTADLVSWESVGLQGNKASQS